MEEVKFAVLLFSSVGLPLASIAYTWVATRDKDNTAHIKAVEATMAEALAKHASRLDSLETTVRYLPAPEKFAELQGDMKAVKANQESTQREMHGVRSSLTRIENFLLSQKQ
ncbi:MAG: hypothetical protein ABS43_03705 [Bordetella sp. SCN 67-23]|nr:MAG: hypothetical protein ABS43_03705 [Bordetella sp. SCN 67-23]OJW91783.1 MAG: hypothetical protein BGO71_21735 [Burkholderiales bacterium 67-32]